MKKVLGFILNTNDSVHIKQYEGVYRIVNINNNLVTITCKKWQALNNYPNRLIVKTIKIKDVKSLHGNNHYLKNDLWILNEKFINYNKCF